MKRVWKWVKIGLAIIFAIVVYVFFTRRIDKSEIKEKIKEVIELAKIEEKKVEKVAKRVIKRKEEAKDLADRLRKHFHMFIIVCLIISVGVIGTVSSSATIENLIIPDTYEELLTAYRDVASIAMGYQKLYNEAEADNDILMESIKNLQGLIKTQQEIINDLLNRNRFSVFTGINFVPLNPSYSGIMGGIVFEF